MNILLFGVAAVALRVAVPGCFVGGGGGWVLALGGGTGCVAGCAGSAGCAGQAAAGCSVGGRGAGIGGRSWRFGGTP